MQRFRKLLALVILAAQCTVSTARETGTAGSCQSKQCPIGAKVVTYASKVEPYYACPTQHLAEYTNFVVGILSMQVVVGIKPQISKATGEPIQTGESLAILNMFRNKAGVTTFDEAISKCGEGLSKLTVYIGESPNDATVFKVINKENTKYFWMPKAMANPVN